MFPEGNPLYDGAGFRDKNHIQICIRNQNCIKAIFDPRVYTWFYFLGWINKADKKMYHFIRGDVQREITLFSKEKRVAYTVLVFYLFFKLFAGNIPLVLCLKGVWRKVTNPVDLYKLLWCVGSVGVLFLDEMPEYPAQRAWSAAPAAGGRGHHRQPRQSAYAVPVTHHAGGQHEPLPCGYYGSKTRHCRCGSHEIVSAILTASRPFCWQDWFAGGGWRVPAVEDIVREGEQESSAQVRSRVRMARQMQLKRFQGSGLRCNAQLTGKNMEDKAQLTSDARTLLQNAVRRYSLSMRAYTRLIKVARTIADLQGEATVELPAMAEAIQFRMIDGKYWGEQNSPWMQDWSWMQNTDTRWLDWLSGAYRLAGEGIGQEFKKLAKPGMAGFKPQPGV